MNMLPRIKENKLRQRWADKQARKVKAVDHSKESLKRAVLAELKEFR